MVLLVSLHHSGGSQSTRFDAAPLFENRNRAGAYGVMLIVGAAMFGMFFYLTQFVQNVLGYSPIKAGFRLRTGQHLHRDLRGCSVTADHEVGRQATGAAWNRARLGRHDLARTDRAGLVVRRVDCLVRMVVFALGLGFTFMPLTLAAVSQIDESDAGIASGVLNTTQQIGGSIGLATLTTVFVTVFTHQLAKILPDFLAATVARCPPAGQPLPPELVSAQVTGWTAAFQVSAGLMVLAFFITLFAIKVTKDEAAHAGPMGAAH